MKPLSSGATPMAKDSAKPVDTAKAAEGLWAALLQGSVLGKVEHAATSSMVSAS
jgi:hypothetical protein